jgi:hypothetical protein
MVQNPNKKKESTFVTLISQKKLNTNCKNNKTGSGPKNKASKGLEMHYFNARQQ